MVFDVLRAERRQVHAFRRNVNQNVNRLVAEFLKVVVAALALDFANRKVAGDLLYGDRNVFQKGANDADSNHVRQN